MNSTCEIAAEYLVSTTYLISGHSGNSDHLS